jgi:anti-anti-sigma factor
VAVVTGEIDLANAAALFACAHDDTAPYMIVDLSAVLFMDSSAIAEIVRLARVRTLRVVAPVGGQPRSVLEITHLVDVIATYETVALALAA